MIKVGTFLSVLDNTGIKKVCCIKIPNGSFCKTASVGDFIIFSVKERQWSRDSIKQKVFLGCVTLVRKPVRRLNGFYVLSPQNCCVSLTKTKELLGSLVNGPVSEEVWKQKLNRLLSVARAVI